MAMLPGTKVLHSGSCGEFNESMMEFERPGEEKKKRCEANAVAKSGGESSPSEEMSEALEKKS